VVSGDDTRFDDLRTWSRDRLRAQQTARLRETVQAAYAAVPHYRAAFDAVGLHPSDVRTLEDLHRVPFTTKEDLRQGYPFGMFAVPRTEVVAAREQRHHRPPHRRRLHAGRPRGVVGGHGPLDPRRRRASR
jgi:phenylacetate-coenzyme A ligase PaaK-like adenylate-forming protein